MNIERGLLWFHSNNHPIRQRIGANGTTGHKIKIIIFAMNIMTIVSDAVKSVMERTIKPTKRLTTLSRAALSLSPSVEFLSVPVTKRFHGLNRVLINMPPENALPTLLTRTETSPTCRRQPAPYHHCSR